MKPSLLDTGPIIALLDRSDPWHAWVVPRIGGLRGRLVTTGAVVTEAMFFLQDAKDGIARLLEELDQQGLMENTIVLFSSDNGPAFMLRADQVPPGMNVDTRRFNCGFNGAKGSVYEGGIRVPMIARWPGHVPSGETSDQVWAFWDVLPTLAELVGVTPPVGIDGISMMPTLLGQLQEQEHEHLYWDYGHSRTNFQQAVRLGNWKGVRRSQDQPLELYDLANDIGETSDVATGHPDVVEHIKQIIEESFVPTENYPITSRQTGNQ